MIHKIIPYFLLLLVLASCEQKENLFPPDTLAISGFEPLAALANDTIFIYGSGFSSSAIGNVVQFTFPIAVGTANVSALATVISAEPTKLQVIVPENILTGRVKVAVGPYSALSEVPFLLSPSISSVNPNGALPNDQITVQGKNFPSDLNQLLLYIGNTKIDSIFGGSTTQIIFPLPEGLAPGLTTIRVGVLLTERDSVFAPPAAFTVFDPNQPTITSITPDSNIPNGEIALKGNAFKVDGGITTAIFTVAGQEFVVNQTDFTKHTTDEIKVKVPAAIDVDGKNEVEAFVTVSITPAGETALVSEPVVFNVLEPSDLVFFYTELNVISSSTDNYFWESSPTAPGQSSKVKITEGASFGVDIDKSNSMLYFGEIPSRKPLVGGTIENITLDGYSSLSDISISADGSKLFYCYASEFQFLVFDLTTQLSTIVSEGVTSLTHMTTFNNKTFWTSKSGGNVQINVSDESLNTVNVYSETTTNFISGIAIANGKIFFVKSPLSAVSVSTGIPSGNSIIYSINIDGTDKKMLYTISNTNVSDLAISENGETLYWMVSSTTGGIMSAPAQGGGTVTTIISGIVNGRYFDVLEKE